VLTAHLIEVQKVLTY